MTRSVHVTSLTCFILLLLTLLAGSATANRLSISSGRSFEATGTLGFEGGLGLIRCPVTLRGTFIAGTMVKRAGTNFRSAEYSIGSCEGSEFTILNRSLTLAYDSFTGTLPTIRSLTLRVEGFEVRLNYSAIFRCLYRGRWSVQIWTESISYPDPVGVFLTTGSCNFSLHGEGALTFTPRESISLI
jgi:hypothetical protein